MANVAAFLLPIKELNTILAPRLITTDYGVHWILLTEENGEIVLNVCQRRRMANAAVYLSLTKE